VKVGHTAALRPARIYHNNPDIRIFLFVCFNSPEEDGMTPCRIGAGDQEAIGKLDVFIGDRHGIFPKHRVKRSDRAAHAQP
jgi:hypothetical protein